MKKNIFNAEDPALKKISTQSNENDFNSNKDSQDDIVRQEVRLQYQKIIKLKEFGLQNLSLCSCNQESKKIINSNENSILGYSVYDRNKVPPQADLGLGCANPKLYANYKKGETVLDLGCGAGFDCFLAAHEVGEEGKVIGVDMMHEMLSKAREISSLHNYRNVEFRLGEIEHLPVADKSIDVIISNCVLNLSPNKKQVIKECKRVMKENARLVLLDVLLDDSFAANEESSKAFLKSTKAAACIKNAFTVSQMQEILKELSFKSISIILHEKSDEIIQTWIQDEEKILKNKIYSAIIVAYR